MLSHFHKGVPYMESLNRTPTCAPNIPPEGETKLKKIMLECNKYVDIF